MNSILEQIGALGIVPVIKIEDADKAQPLAEAMCAGGLPLAEITFRTASAAKAIENVAKHVPDMLVGAGTVLTCEQVDRALDAGARFIVSPGFNEKVVQHCIKRGVPITPGCSCPSDLERAIENGLEVVKFFPAEQSGGLKYIKAISAPYAQLRFIPTGGISTKNLNEYLSFGKVLACGGSWLAPADLVAAGDFAGVERIVREAVSLVLGVTIRHIGVNAADAGASLDTARAFASLLRTQVKQGNSSNFAGTLVEVMKEPFRGAHGHIALGVNSIPRALAYMARCGFAADMTSAKYDDAGAIKTVYLSDEIGGFAIHLLQN